jgi:hypothetical protein
MDPQQGQGVVSPVPPLVVDLVQKGLLDRAFGEPLFPNVTLYRSIASHEFWEANSGQEVFITRQGLLPAIVTPLKPNKDPEPQALSYEQYGMFLEPYGGTMDTYMPNSTVQIANQFLANVKALGLQAAMSLNRLARNRVFTDYLSGHTVLTATATSGATQLQVASINGFTDVVIQGQNVRPKPVSPQYPLQVTLVSGATSITRNVVGFEPNDPNFPNGPGVLQLSAAVGGSGMPIRAGVFSTYRPSLIYSGGGNTIDSVGVADILSIQDIINAVAILRSQNIRPHRETGLYHAQIGALANAQIFADPVFQRLNRGLPDGMRYKEGWLGELSGVGFWLNNESPFATSAGGTSNVGALVETDTSSSGTSYFASDIGSEIINANGVSVGQVLITGEGVLYERSLPHDGFLTEAGVNGKLGEFNVTNGGLSIATENVQLVLRAPTNRLQNSVAATWYITTGFACPTDLTAMYGQMRYRRAIVLRHAQGSVSA